LLIAEKYFMNVTCFLLFNVCSMLGSLIAAFIELVILYSVVLFCIAILTGTLCFCQCL